MLSRQEEELQRKMVLENDRRILEQQRAKDQSGTFLSHTHIDDAGGRFAGVNAATVVGQEPVAKYPQASTPWQGPDLVGDEPPTGYEIHAVEPLENPAGVFPVVSPPAGDAPVPEAPSSEVHQPLADDVETGIGAPPSSEQTNE